MYDAVSTICILSFFHVLDYLCSKKSTKTDQQVETGPAEEPPETSLSQSLLAPDPVLWNHMSFLQKYIQLLESVEAQAKKLAE